MIKFEAESNAPRNIDTASGRYIAAALDRVAGEAQRVARTEAPANTGQLANSILLFRQHTPPTFSAGIETNLPYALVMERGRRPGTWPNIGAIERWVYLKRAEFNIRGRSRDAAKAVKGLAFVIARSIKNKGITGRAFFFKAEQHVVALLGDEAETIGIQIKSEWDKGGR